MIFNLKQTHSVILPEKETVQSKSRTTMRTKHSVKYRQHYGYMLAYNTPHR